jgi:hypothetical protein
MMIEMDCGECGGKVGSDDLFCPSCGFFFGAHPVSLRDRIREKIRSAVKPNSESKVAAMAIGFSVVALFLIWAFAIPGSHREVDQSPADMATIRSLAQAEDERKARKEDHNLADTEVRILQDPNAAESKAEEEEPAANEWRESLVKSAVAQGLSRASVLSALRDPRTGRLLGPGETAAISFNYNRGQGQGFVIPSTDLLICLPTYVEMGLPVGPLHDYYRATFVSSEESAVLWSIRNLGAPPSDAAEYRARLANFVKEAVTNTMRAQEVARDEAELSRNTRSAQFYVREVVERMCSKDGLSTDISFGGLFSDNPSIKPEGAEIYLAKGWVTGKFYSGRGFRIRFEFRVRMIGALQPEWEIQEVIRFEDG